MTEYIFDNIIYFKCQSCDAKIHCDQCGEELKERLLAVPGIDDIDFQMKEKIVSVKTVMLSEDDIEDCLDEAGIFL